MSTPQSTVPKTIDVDALCQGQRRALAKAITLIESKRLDHRTQAQALLQQVAHRCGRSLRIGISGTPGVGKSTFIEAFGLFLVEQGKKLAVLAVDPSSPVSGGSIMGDKTRMEHLCQHPHAFIRPSPAGDTLGGVAQRTRESLLICEAAGFDVIVVETVGVGQSEVDVASMVDFFLVMLLPNGGDELQGIKKGIIELADGIVINKADGDAKAMAEKTKIHYQSALHLLAHRSFWSAQVLTTSAKLNQGLVETWQMLQDYQQQADACGYFKDRRAAQNKQWMARLVQELIQYRLKNIPGMNHLWPQLEQDVINGVLTPYQAAEKILAQF